MKAVCMQLVKQNRACVPFNKCNGYNVTLPIILICQQLLVMLHQADTDGGVV